VESDPCGIRLTQWNKNQPIFSLLPDKTNLFFPITKVVHR
jgi:hypothetical protein